MGKRKKGKKTLDLGKWQHHFCLSFITNNAMAVEGKKIISVDGRARSAMLRDFKKEINMRNEHKGASKLVIR